MVAAPRAVGIEIGGLDAMLDQILSRWAVFLDRAGGRDVIGGNAVAEHCQHARILDIFHRNRLQRHTVEVGSAADVSRIFIPRVGLAFGYWQATPALIPVINLAVASPEHV